MFSGKNIYICMATSLSSSSCLPGKYEKGDLSAATATSGMGWWVVGC